MLVRLIRCVDENNLWKAFESFQVSGIGKEKMRKPAMISIFIQLSKTIAAVYLLSSPNLNSATQLSSLESFSLLNSSIKA